MAEPAPQSPSCTALVLCDAVHKDPGTGKFFLLGTFGRMVATTVPIPARFAAYFVLTGGLGETPFSVRIVDAADLLNEEEPIVEVPGMVQFIDPIADLECALGFDVAFPKTGVYHCELRVGGEWL